MFGGLDEFFAPGRRHAEEERRRLALTREDAGDADPSRGPIDLSSGRVTIRVPGSGAEPGAVPGTEPGRGTGAGAEPGTDAGAAPGSAAGGGAGSVGGGEEVEAVGQGGGFAPAGDAELGKDVRDVDAGGLR
ncbi:DUF6191 domain-containing protein [Streptomyces termitum]|uniref:Uncharacterized protein n=1 Tax=Streptomyces termitum TaxID=67368 RepID=A0A918SWH1_9ACTN|nr:hypothetical protein GCM10010305_16900 [Streptomyces termitum]